MAYNSKVLRTPGELPGADSEFNAENDQLNQIWIGFNAILLQII